MAEDDLRLFHLDSICIIIQLDIHFFGCNVNCTNNPFTEASLEKLNSLFYVSGMHNIGKRMDLFNTLKTGRVK